MAELGVSKLDDSNDSIKLNGVPSDANLDCENEEESKIDDEQEDSSCVVGRKRTTPTSEMNNVEKLHDSSPSIIDKSSNALANGHLRTDKVTGESSSAADERDAEPMDTEEEEEEEEEEVSPAQISCVVADGKEPQPTDEESNVISNGEDSSPSSPAVDDSRSDESSSHDRSRLVSNIGSAMMPLDLGPNEIARTNSGLSITMVPTPKSSDEQNSRWDRASDERASGEASSTKDAEAISLCSPSDKQQGKKYQKKSLPSVNITPRRSSRNLNKQRSYNDKDGDIYEDGSQDGLQIRKLDDDDIEEITPTDPLADDSRSKPRNKAIVVSDTKGLVEFATNARISKSNKKEPTLVIIDTKSILSGRGPVPVSVSQSSGGPALLHTSASSTPIPVSLPISASSLNSNSRSLSVSSPAFSVIPIGLPTTGLYPHFRNPPPQIKPIVVGPASTTVTPISIQASSSSSSPAASSVGSSPASVTAVSVPASAKQPSAVLPSLTDDMFVVEAPSFIVPYVYEKPPMKALKEFIEKIETEIKEAKEKEAEEKRKLDAEEKSRLDALEKEKSEAKEAELKEASHTKMSVDEECEEAKKEDGLVEDKSESADADKAAEAEKPDEDKNTKAEDECTKEDVEVSKSATEKPEAMETDSEESERTASNEVGTSDKAKVNDSGAADAEKKDEQEVSTTAKDDSKKSTNAVDDSKKPQSFFDNPLGKFFIQIGLNLVQEHVQTDLLRSQKRKRDKEGENCSPEVHATISELTRTLESSKENNDPFKLDTKKCELCSFRTESILVMAHHLETPHMKNYTYRCNFCPHEVRSPHDILYHMEAEHNVRGRLERAPAFHQCANCPFEDNQKGKLTRHMVSCAKKYRPERNQEPPLDWEPPAKIPRVTRNRPPSMSPGNAVYQAAMSGLKQAPQNTLLPKLMPNASNAKQNMMNSNKRPSAMNTNFVGRFPNANTQSNFQQRPISLQNSNQGLMYRTPLTNSQTQVLLPQNFQFTTSPTSLYQATSVKQPQQGSAAAKLMNQPSISITPLPRQSPASQSCSSSNNAVMNSAGQGGKGGKSGAAASATSSGSNNKNSFVVCEICDGYIKDLEQLRNHMQWIHKVKIHPKMIYNRPPLNCQKCQFRFFTDQGLERHLLGSHGLVTSSMQEAANKGKDGGRCPICGRVYQWKLLNHVARDHQMALKPAHLSYKCTVCTATFGMYKQFESHVYSAHSVVAKRAMDPKKPPSISSASQNDALLKPLKINDEITIIPQPARSAKPMNKMMGSASSIVNARSKDVIEERLCARKCTPRDFSTIDAFKRHLLTQHVRKFNVKLTRIDGESESEMATAAASVTRKPQPTTLEVEALLRKHQIRSLQIRLPNLGALREDVVYKVLRTSGDEEDEEAVHRRVLSLLRFSMRVDESRSIEITSVPYRVWTVWTKRRPPETNPRATGVSLVTTPLLQPANENAIAECGTFGNHFLMAGRAPPSVDGSSLEDKASSLQRAISFSTAYVTDATKAHPVLASSLVRDVAGTAGVPIVIDPGSRTSSAPTNVVVRKKIYAKTLASKPLLKFPSGLPAGAYIPVSIAGNRTGDTVRLVHGRFPSQGSSTGSRIYVAIQPAKSTTPAASAPAENDVIILSSSDSDDADDGVASDKNDDEIVAVQPRKSDSTTTVQEYILPM